MASQSLYRKWRSQTFSDLVGQEPVIRTLKNALNSGTLAHAYLFAGPRGTGKTSTARLLAKTINCLNPQNGEPCNQCLQCQEITIGNSFNVIEIDAASNRGIDSIRELREKVMMPPTTGKYKVYILDEAHMLTTEAFNALLKTLEEPPPHAIFVMATTDVHKMLPTVLSRCQRFDFKRITTRQIVEHLQFVAQQEQVTLERGAAELLARAAAGGMRDALSLLDQAIAYCGQSIGLYQVQAMLGVADPRAIQKFITHIAEVDSANGLHLINELANAGADLRQINTQVAEYFRAMMLARAGANIAEILDGTQDEINEITQLARLFALEELTECARIFAQNELMQKNLGTPQLGLELALLNCIELHRRAQGGEAVSSVPAPVARPVSTAPSQRPATPPPPKSAASTPRPQLYAVTPEPVEQRPPVPASAQPATPPPSHVQETTQEPDTLPDWDAIRYDDEIDGEPAVPAPSPISQPQPTPAMNAPEVPKTPVLSASQSSQVEHAASAESGIQQNASDADAPTLTVEEVQEHWEAIKRRIKTRKDGHIIAALLLEYTILAIEGTRALPVVVIRARQSFHFKSLDESEDRRKAIEWAMKVELHQECRVRLLPPGGQAGSSMVIPPPPTGANTLQARMAAYNQRSAHREPPSSPREKPQASLVQVPPTATVEEVPIISLAPPPAQTAVPTVVNVNISATAPVQPSARINVVKENISTGAIMRPVEDGKKRQVPIEREAKSDPVVREVMRIFKAEITEIQKNHFK